VRRDAELGQQTDPRNATRRRRLLAAVAASVLVLHRALPDLQRMKHKPDQALGHREVFLFLPS
jgi:hypothetical protein